jgi:DNA helicase II / ATP-dependent DNA helicase PcrA
MMLMELSGLNKEQRNAVTAPRGPVLVLAGAGSGKTRVLTYRIAYIIEQGWYEPNQILAVTFTNKAAKEMQNRIHQLLSGGGSKKLTSQPTLGTFHSIGVRILRKHIARLGYAANFVIADSDDQLKIIKEILKDLSIPKQYGPNLFRSYISSAKNLLQTPAQMDLALDGPLRDIAAQVYARYQDFLFKQNSVDFDDLLMLPIILFQTFPEVLRQFQERWHYILVDEYQDTNQAQYLFLHLLAKSGNLFVVGDDAQSIYGFRGSNIANILNFEKDFPGALVIKLEQNYRSTKNILSAAQKVIELNAEQKPKTLWTDNDEGDMVVIKEVYDGHAEAVFVARKIVQLSSGEEDELEYESEEEPEATQNQTFSILDTFLAKQKRRGGSAFSNGVPSEIPQLPKDHEPLTEYAVLYRTHAQSREIEEVFISAGIPYHIVGGVKFYERKEIKDVLAYLRLLVNPLDVMSLGRVINLPPRGIGDKSFDTIRLYVLNLPKGITQAEFSVKLRQLNLPPKQTAGLNQFLGILLKCDQVPDETTLSELLKVVVKLSGIDEFLRDGTDVGEIRRENVRELFNVTSKFDNSPWREGLEMFLEEVALITDLDNLADERNSVTLMTLHAAKGLEFDTVFFVGLEEGILPHTNSLFDPKELAEEVRLAYVGLTRARKRLFLLYAQGRQMYGSFQNNAPSRILHALPESAIKAAATLPVKASDDDYTYEPFE